MKGKMPMNGKIDKSMMKNGKMDKDCDMMETPKKAVKKPILKPIVKKPVVKGKKK
jgi:ribosomal protein L13E